MPSLSAFRADLEVSPYRNPAERTTRLKKGCHLQNHPLAAGDARVLAAWIAV